MNRDQAGPLRIALTLGVTGLLCGVVIVAVHELTRDTIATNQASALRAALTSVLPRAASFSELAYHDDRLAPAQAGEEAASIVYAGRDEAGTLVGYAIQGAGPGYQDTIRLLFGYQPDDGLVVGMHVLESRETPGLGDRIYKDRAFVEGFGSLATSPPIKAMKKGTRTAPNEIDAITGATISSIAVVRIINASIATWAPRLTTPSAVGSTDR